MWQNLNFIIMGRFSDFRHAWAPQPADRTRGAKTNF